MKAMLSPTFTPDPDFGTMSDYRLKQYQELVQADIDHADDEREKIFHEQRMRRLQAERKRRASGAKSPTLNGHQPSTEPDKPLLVTMDQIAPETVSWLWTDRLPFSRLILIDGDPGAGKSYLSLAIAAALSAGRPLPGDNKQRGREQVLLMSVEDDYADTVRPRLDALGADVSRIAIPNPQRVSRAIAQISCPWLSMPSRLAFLWLAKGSSERFPPRPRS